MGLSIDNFMACIYPIFMRTNKCHEKGTQKTAGVESSASQVSGAHLPAQQIMANKFDGESITALQEKLSWIGLQNENIQF